MTDEGGQNSKLLAASVAGDEVKVDRVIDNRGGGRFLKMIPQSIFSPRAPVGHKKIKTTFIFI